MSRLREHLWLIGPLLLGVIAISAGCVLDPARWAHAAIMPELDSAERLGQLEAGARLLRTMLLLSGAGLIIAPVLLARLTHRLGPPTSRSAPTEGVHPRTLFIIELLIIALGASLRLLRISESLWYDEIVGLGFAVREPATIVSSLYDPANHVLHTLLTHLSIGMMNDVELSARLPALLASLLTISVMMRLARPFGTRAMIIAGVFTALLPVLVLEGVEARGYSMMIFFSGLSTALFIRADGRRDPLMWCLYAGACALGIWSHLMMVWVPIGHGVIVALRAVRRRSMATAWPALVALLLGAMLTLTLYAPALGDLLRSQQEAVFARRPATPGLFGAEGLHIMLQAGGVWDSRFGWPWVGLTVFGVIVSWSTPKRRRTLALLLAGLPVMLACTLAFDTWTYARFALFMMPGIVLAMTFGLDVLLAMVTARGKSSGARIASVVIGAMVVAGPIGLDWNRPAKQPLRTGVEFIVAHAGRERPNVVALGLAHRVLDVYAGPLDLRYCLRHGENLEAALTQRPPDWVILYYPASVDASRYALLRQRGYT
ncbi:MAG: glycosyltransferase family 39 protein, partial [Phycisphaerales bacterium]|nr:glycosyltransferase family 39 protein [Phycisphaerales bacterium]